MASESSLIFNIIGRDKVGSTLARVKAEVAAANDEQVKGASAVERAIEKTRVETERLGQEFKRTGDVDVFKAWKQSEKVLTGLKKIRTDVEKLGTDGKKSFSLLDFALDEFVVKAGKAVVNGISDAADAGVKSAGNAIASNPWLSAAIAAGITLGVPAIGGALTAAIGGAGIAAGIILAARDPKVGQAWGEFSKSASTQLTGAAGVFVQPLVAGAKIFGDTLNGILPAIRHDFEAVAPVVEPLVRGVAGLVTNLMPGLGKAFEQAGPMLTEIANDLPKIGEAASFAFQQIASGAGGGKQALHDLITLIDATVASTGAAIGAFEKWYLLESSVFSALAGNWSRAKENMVSLLAPAEANVTVAGTVKQGMDALAASMVGVGHEASITGDQFTALSGKISATAQTSDVLVGQMVDKVVNSMLAGDQATLGFEKSLTSLSDALKTNKDATDIHTAAGQADREAILAVVAANVRAYDQNIAVGMSADAASAAYDANTAALENQMRQAGLTQGQIDDLIGKYRGVPSTVNTNIATYGLTEAINNLADLIARLNHVNGYVARSSVIVTTDYIENHQSVYNQQVPYAARAQRYGGVHYAARGLLNLDGMANVFPAGSGPTYGFAEPGTGGEAFIARNAPDGASLKYADVAARWHGGMVVPKGQTGHGLTVNVTVNAGVGTNGAAVGAAIVTEIKKYEQANGKGWRS